MSQKYRPAELPAAEDVSETILQLKKAIVEAFRQAKLQVEEARKKALDDDDNTEDAPEQSRVTNHKNQLMEKITEEEKEKVTEAVQKLRDQAKKREERDRRKTFLNIKDVHQHVTFDEVILALKENDESELVSKFGDPDFVCCLRKRLTTRKTSVVDPSAFQRKNSQKGGPRIRRFPRLLLDAALSGDQSQWSEARQKAYSQIDQNPNSYYYRFNAPGEAQKNGPFSEEEHQLFVKRVEERGGWENCDRDWGIFSMAIPGRVGYQCSNYYRKLIKDNVVTQHRYVFDADGKMHHLSRKEEKLRGSPGSGEPRKRKTPEAKKSSKGKPKRGKKKCADEIRACDVSDESDEGTEDERPAKQPRKRASSRSKVDEADAAGEQEEEEMEDTNNPLPEMRDPIDFEPLRKPAMSPWGHVMSYDNWVQCLVYTEPKNVCPFTKNTLTTRQLVKLTTENIDQYRSQIVAV